MSVHSKADSNVQSLYHPLAITALLIIAIILVATRQNALTLIAFFLFTSVGFKSLGVQLRRIFSTIHYLLWMLPITFFMHVGLSQFGWDFVRSLLNATPQFMYLNPAIMFTLQIFGFMFMMGGAMQLLQLDRLLDSLYLGLQPLRKLKLPVDDFFQILFLGLRFFPLLREEAKRVQEVRRGFGVTDSESLIGRIRGHVATAIPMFVGTLYRAEIVAQTMNLRGYIPGKKRSVYTDLHWHTRDSILVSILVLLTAVVFVV